MTLSTRDRVERILDALREPWPLCHPRVQGSLLHIPNSKRAAKMAARFVIFIYNLEPLQ